MPSIMLDISDPVHKKKRKAPVPEGPVVTESGTDVGSSLLSCTQRLDADEEYSRDEQMLNDFTKFHPMTR